MVPEHQRLSPEERSNLVAYLDGELSPPQAEEVAVKLTQSLTARREVDSLRRTWELLDHLDRPQASADFASKTLAQAVVQAGRGDRFISTASRITRRAVIVTGWLVAGMTLFGAGFAITARLWPNPSARLTLDLTIAESLDAYREVGGLEFLRQLDAAPEFH